MATSDLEREPQDVENIEQLIEPYRDFSRFHRVNEPLRTVSEVRDLLLS